MSRKIMSEAFPQTYDDNIAKVYGMLCKQIVKSTLLDNPTRDYE